MRTTRRVTITVLTTALVLTACSDSEPRVGTAEGPAENAPLVSERVDGALVWTATEESVELAVQLSPATPVAGKEVVALLEAVDRRGGLSTVAIVWGEEAEAPVPGDLIVDCVAGAKTPTEDTPDKREQRRETHVYAEPGHYTVVAIAIGAGCGYSNRATVRRALTVAIEATPLDGAPR